MDLNRLIFPAPDSSYTPFSLENLLWIPRTRFFSMKTLVKTMDKYEDFYFNSRDINKPENVAKQGQISIPCHYQAIGEGNKNIILYFHGNAEDIGYASGFARKLALGLKADILSVEYPGYGVYEGESNAKTILEDAEIVFDFLTAEVGINAENIIVFGRSIGSGPATHLAANRKPGALILMSPYTSIKAVVRDIAGQILSSLFAERFSNIDEIEKAECPCFFIHGKKDKIIPWEHSRALFVKCKSAAGISISETMTHNTFKLIYDIINPAKKFLKQLGIKSQKGKIVFPEYVLKVPLKEYRAKSRDFTSKIIDNIVCES